MAEDDDRSEWNEQKAYSLAYFKLGDKCRLAQLHQDVKDWHTALLGKMIILQGVLTKESDVQEIMGWAEEIDKVLHNYNVVYSTENMGKYRTVESPMTLKLKHDCFKKFFAVEGMVDRMMNNKMPFLNKGQKFDIMGL